MPTVEDRQFVRLLMQGQTPADAARLLHWGPEEAEETLRRNGVATWHQLLARALVYGWIIR